MPDDIVVGSVLGVFGVRGELKVAAADPQALRHGAHLRLRRPSQAEKEAVVETVRPHKSFLVVRLRGVDDADAAASLQGATVVMKRADLGALPQGTYRAADLVGMAVIDAARGALGNVIETRRYPSCDMLVVGSARLLVPLLHAYDARVDIEAREIRVSLPAGFEEL